ncbi:AN1-type zinc finger protein [Halorubrum sp. LN27]|uniref:AN1-type zinc finger domain-containing protein n=1 Tax=Halorubrum sp. LN27 TaxID=2801032 RepID=UPI00190A2E4F|nr:AN1-type zinc finger protein [Halorubrum sp. LN27]
MECEECGNADSMSYTCSRCGNTYCVSHRLPESHECVGLKIEKANRAALREEGENIPWFQGESAPIESRSSGSRLDFVIGLVWLIITFPFRTKLRFITFAILVTGIYLYF